MTLYAPDKLRVGVAFEGCSCGWSVARAPWRTVPWHDVTRLSSRVLMAPWLVVTSELLDLSDQLTVLDSRPVKDIDSRDIWRRGMATEVELTTGGAAEAEGEIRDGSRRPCCRGPWPGLPWSVTGTRALLVCILILSACSNLPTVAPVATPKVMLRGAPDGGRAPRFFRTRVQHYSNSSSTWNVTRVIISGDVELNPGPALSSVDDSKPTSARTVYGVAADRQLSCTEPKEQVEHTPCRLTRS